MTFNELDENCQMIHSWKALDKYFHFDNEFKTLLTSARFIVIRLYEMYDVIMTSVKFWIFKF